MLTDPILARGAGVIADADGTAVKGFVGTINGQTVAVQVFKEGPFAGQLATAVVPNAGQLAQWGVVLP